MIYDVVSLQRHTLLVIISIGVFILLITKILIEIKVMGEYGM